MYFLIGETDFLLMSPKNLERLFLESKEMESSLYFSRSHYSCHYFGHYNILTFFKSSKKIFSEHLDTLFEIMELLYCLKIRNLVFFYRFKINFTEYDRYSWYKTNVKK